MTLNPEYINAIRGPDGTERFFRASIVQDENSGELKYLKPSSTQRPILTELDATNDWLILNKPRQAHVSTLCALWLLKETEYNPGRKGLLLANKADTTEELLGRVLIAYRSQPASIKAPVSRISSSGIQFKHGGEIKIATARGDNPAIGFSADRLVCSEYGMWEDDILGQLLPIVAKRAHARVIIESTPGRFGGHYHDLWLRSLAGQTQFKPKFTPWWKHRAYAKAVGPGFAQSIAPIEKQLLEKYEGMTHEHLAFRRFMLASACHGDARILSNQYPNDEMDGWTTTKTPALPSEHLSRLLPGKADLPYMQTRDLPIPGHKYVLIADPNSYGEVGDPSAYSLWDATTRIEDCAWSGRVDPVQFGQDLVKLAKRYDALLVIESNAAACITAAVNTGYRNIYFNNQNRDHPGWYATAQAKERATTALVEALAAKKFEITSGQGILQTLAFDGSWKRRSGHHWDRYMTYLIAADVFASGNFAYQKPVEVLPPGVYRLDHMAKDIARATRGQ